MQVHCWLALAGSIYEFLTSMHMRCCQHLWPLCICSISGDFKVLVCAVAFSLVFHCRGHIPQWPNRATGLDRESKGRLKVDPARSRWLLFARHVDNSWEWFPKLPSCFSSPDNSPNMSAKHEVSAANMARVRSHLMLHGIICFFDSPNVGVGGV
jgi:hypothetical protein